jgi:ABC-type phosphate transport system substrate-binding protein
MRSRFGKARVRIAAVALGVTAIGCLATAPASIAVSTQQPPVGANCHPDGKIDGAGSTFQTNALNDAFTYGFQLDNCGPQPSSSGLFTATPTWSGTDGNGGTVSAPVTGWSADPSQFSFGTPATSVNGMAAYNSSNGGVAPSNGSGTGLKRASCRVDMFEGTDLPYNHTQLAALNAAPGNDTSGSVAPWNAQPFECDTYSSQTSYFFNGPPPAAPVAGIWNLDKVPPPFGPQTYNLWGQTAAQLAADTPAQPAAYAATTSKVMGFPVAGGAVAFVANMNGVCANLPIPANTTLDLTPAEMDGIWQGTINQWNDAVLDATNPWLVTQNCTGNIQRVVRFDNSGTTAITMWTLNGYNQSVLCHAGANPTPTTGPTPLGGWYNLSVQSSNAGFWPRTCTDINNAQGTSNPLNTVAPNEINAGSNGSPALISLTESTNGGIGYAELGLWGTLPSANDVFVRLPTPATQASATPTFTLPGTPGHASLCSYPANLPVSNAPTNAVSLNTSVNWSNDGATGAATAASPGKQDVADPSGGTGYPACGLTFDMAYTQQSESHEVAAPTGSDVASTPGCTIAAPPTQTTTVDNPAGSVAITVPSTAGWPATGTITVANAGAGNGDYPYTGLTATSFTGVAATANDIPIGATITLSSTTAPATATAPGINGACQTAADSVPGVTNDQLRTEYSYFTYVFSPLGQSITALGATNTNLGNQTLDSMPAGWLPSLVQGFQQNF